MTQLVKAGSVKTVRVFKSLESGHRNEVPARRVVGLTLAFAKICAGDCYEILRVRVALVQIEGCHCGMQHADGEILAARAAEAFGVPFCCRP